MVVVTIFLFIGSSVLLWRMSHSQNSALVNRFLDRTDRYNERLVDVVEKNTQAMTAQAESNRAVERAVHRMADVVDTKLGE